MSRPRTQPVRVTTALRLPVDLHTELKAAADARDVGVNWLTVRLIEEGMGRLVPVEQLRLVKPRRVDPDEWGPPAVAS